MTHNTTEGEALLILHYADQPAMTTEVADQFMRAVKRLASDYIQLLSECRRLGHDAETAHAHRRIAEQSCDRATAEVARLTAELEAVAATKGAK